VQVEVEMRLKVTDTGVVIPRDMLPDVDEVDVRMEVISPVRNVEDPIWRMGSDPVNCGLPDAAEHHDKHIYGSLRETPDDRAG
jgi:hypothetical protein